MPREGNLAESSFCEVLADLSLRHETGVLRLNGATSSKSVYLQDGKIVFASSTDPDDRLGELLLTRGIITRQQLEEAAKSLKPGKRLGTALVEQGFLPASDLPRWVRDQVKEILFSLFSWTEGSFVFEAGPFPSDEAITLRLPTPEIFLSGLKLVQKWSVLRKGAGEIRIPYQLTANPLGPLKDVSLGEEEEKLLHLLESRPVTMEQAALESGLTTLRVYQLFFAFRVLGVLAPMKVPAPARPGDEKAAAGVKLEEAILDIATGAEPASPASPAATTALASASPPASLQPALAAERPASPRPAVERAAPPAPAPDAGSETLVFDLAELPGAEPSERMVQAPSPGGGANAWQAATDAPPPATRPVRAAPAALPQESASAPSIATTQEAPIRLPMPGPDLLGAAGVKGSRVPATAPAARPPIIGPISVPTEGGPPPLPTAADTPSPGAAAAAAGKRSKPDLRVVRLDDRRLEGEGPQHLEDLVRQWIAKGYRLAGVVPARASGLFGSSGSTYLVFTRENAC